jgi:hypothetical protein
MRFARHLVEWHGERYTVICAILPSRQYSITEPY